ncbi:lycopene cyclase domain-containing protein [Ornithinimicrobium sp. Arc0846-15]|nr:lycopene cyclase domain-containing protein [Ornithinimicrobium laminariae]
MNFWELNFVFLGVSAAILLVAVLTGRVRGRQVSAIVVSTLVLWVLTAIFDNLMIASGLFDYGGHALSGVFIGLAPLEDFAYPLGAILLLPAIWLLLTPRSGTDSTPEAS